MVRKPRSFRRRRIAPGLMKASPGTAPGTLKASPLSVPTQIMVIAYGPEGYIEHSCQSMAEVEKFIGIWPVVWVNVSGLADVAVIEQIGLLFNIDRLLLEDVLDSNHRPKVEFYEHHVFTILKSGALAEQFESDQVALFLKKNVMVVFQERASHSFEQVRERIRRGTGKIRHSGTDYLFYALVDEIIDRYFPILDRINTLLSTIEDQMISTEEAGDDMVQRIHHAKSDLLLLHRTIWPFSDIIGMLMREETPLITKNTRSFMKDCLDHSIQANELAQFYRDTAVALLNTFLAYENHKTNETVKVLTMVSVVFIPLSFIASVYGMNFDYMPELAWKGGYFFMLAVMLLVALVMVVLFRKKGWIRHRSMGQLLRDLFRG